MALRDFDTILRFKGDQDKLFGYIAEVNREGDDVIFKNEGLIFPSDRTNESAEASITRTMLMSMYCTMYRNPDILRNYVEGLLIMQIETEK